MSRSDSNPVPVPPLPTGPAHDTTLVNAYFEQCYPMFPVLDEHRIRAAMSKYQDQRMTSSPTTARSNTSSEWLVESILALLETRDQVKSNQRAGHRLAAISQKAMPMDLIAHPDVDTIMGCLHLFVAYTMTNDKMTAWFYVQQGLTLLLMITSDDWLALSQDPELFRLYLILSVLSPSESTDSQIHLRTRVYDSRTAPTEYPTTSSTAG